MRTGKIARLPRHIRTLLNRRLRDGEPARPLVHWLNSLPEVQTILQRDFNSRPISEVNLTEWKQGGYREWLIQQEALEYAGELAADADELNTIAHALPDHLATILTARFAAELSTLSDTHSDETHTKLRALGNLCRDVAELQRGTHDAARVKIEQARLNRDREKTDEDTFDYFIRWLEYPKVWACITDQSQTQDQCRQRLRDLFGLKPAKLTSAIPIIEPDAAYFPPVQTPKPSATHEFSSGD